MTERWRFLSPLDGTIALLERQTWKFSAHPWTDSKEWVRIRTCPLFDYNFSTPICSLLKTNIFHCSYMYIFYCLQKVHITYILHKIEIRPKLYTSWIDKSYTCSFILNTGSKDRLKLLTIAVIRMTASFSATGNNTHIETGPKDLVLGWYWTQVPWLEAFSLFLSAVLVFVYILQVSTQTEIISSRQYIVKLFDYD